MAITKKGFEDTSKVETKPEVKETVREISKENVKVTQSPIVVKYSIEADNDIICEKDRLVDVSIKNPGKATIYAVATSPLLDYVGVDHKEIINFENGNVIKLRLTSVASSLSYNIKKGSKLFDLVPIA